MKVDLYSQTGEKSGSLELPKECFEVEYNEDLIHQALVRQLANGRVAIAHTKTKAEVSGGGRKPFRQKGTGRARQGSIRSPHMKGGGVVFGPRNERNFTKDMPRKQRRKALLSALSLKVKNKEVIGLEGYSAKAPKTKEFVSLMSKLPITRNVLIVMPEKNAMLQKSAANLPNTKTILASYLNIHDLQKYSSILILKDSVKVIQDTFSPTKK
ncbi:50S ribosomal protein L4 [Candidatus Peregrinibacteria bacterium HGW-Peregrinibacteria-1]|jgi:large subunit ribosomal protein L4|nr:ribosomal protein L4 [uncultured bacterium]PKL36302.1 MAG: 50S ribosomal protein L4 [Candidatus Peregrinibacteria bacterium HGW-Peregrinibacteria-1]